MPGFWDALGQGLQSAGGILSPEVYNVMQNQRSADLARAAQDRQLSAKAIIEGIQGGSIDPAQGRAALSQLGFGGLPVGPSMEAQLNRQAINYFGGGGQGSAPGAGMAPGGLAPSGGGSPMPSGPLPPAVAMSPIGRAITQQRSAEALIAQRERDKEDPFITELKAAGLWGTPEGSKLLRKHLDKLAAPSATQPTEGSTPLGSDPSFWYEFYDKTKTLPPIAWGTAGNPTRQQFIEGFPKWKKAQGGSASDTAASQAAFHADAGALNAVTKDLNTFEPYKKMLDTNADIAISLGQKIAQTDARLANRTLNWFRQNASSNPDVAEYLAQMRFVQTEAARVINNPRIVGQLTDESRREMDSVIDGSAPIAVVDRVLRRLQTDGSNRFDAMRSQQAQIIQGMKSGGQADPLVYKGYRFPSKEALDKFKADGG